MWHCPTAPCRCRERTARTACRPSCRRCRRTQSCPRASLSASDTGRTVTSRHEPQSTCRLRTRCNCQLPPAACVCRHRTACTVRRSRRRGIRTRPGSDSPRERSNAACTRSSLLRRPPRTCPSRIHGTSPCRSPRSPQRTRRQHTQRMRRLALC